MIDKINKIFAVLAKVHAATYFLVGGLCTTSLYVYLVEPQTHKIWFKWIGYSGIFAMLAYYLLSKFFYDKYELGRKNLVMNNRGMVMRDAYFYTKINNDITSTKKMAGYLYVVLRLWVNVVLGFALFTIIISGVKKGLGL